RSGPRGARGGTARGCRAAAGSHRSCLRRLDRVVRTTLLSTAVPNPGSGNGASITLALIAEALRERGQEVSICPIVYPEYVTPDGANYERQVEIASSLGYEVAPVVSDAWREAAVDRSAGS